MIKTKVALIAFPGAPEEVISKGEEKIKKTFKGVDFEITEQNPEVLFIVTGGSEFKAKQIVDNKSNAIILAETANNSYAAATEVKSYCNNIGVKSLLYNIDTELDVEKKFTQAIQSFQVLEKLKSYKVGLIGNVSEWLINSDINKELLNDKFGINLEQIDWEKYPKFDTFSSNDSFISHFNESDFDLTESSKVYNLLQDIIAKEKLDAITVECFPLVQENAVTACLALSKFNTDNIAAGCEGDIASIVGKIICKELVGQIPWMANMAGIEEDKVFLAHCTIATDLVEDYTIKTHFETNEGTAIQGKYKSEDVTVFRLNKSLDKAFLSTGKIVEYPKREDACRTQIKVELDKADILKIKNNPLGNHHLVIPGSHAELIAHFFKQIGIYLV